VFGTDYMVFTKKDGYIIAVYKFFEDFAEMAQQRN